jgi:hypothetical protein
MACVAAADPATRAGTTRAIAKNVFCMFTNAMDAGPEPVKQAAPTGLFLAVLLRRTASPWNAAVAIDDSLSCRPLSSLY